ncbi:hypothetical protein CR513_07844, partial [Mucuna pruriens]
MSFTTFPLISSLLIPYGRLPILPTIYKNNRMSGTNFYVRIPVISNFRDYRERKETFMIHAPNNRKMSWSGGDWMCGVCQHINFKKREACQSCGYPKYGGPDPSTYRYNRTEALAGDWFCNCGGHNYASRSCCYRCGAMKDYYSSGYGSNSGEYGSDTFSPGWKTGDWLCPRIGCGVHNYASRTECFKCKMPRDFGEKTEKKKFQKTCNMTDFSKQHGSEFCV